MKRLYLPAHVMSHTSNIFRRTGIGSGYQHCYFSTHKSYAIRSAEMIGLQWTAAKYKFRRKGRALSP